MTGQRVFKGGCLCGGVRYDPAAIEPEYHIWLGSRIPWLEIADDLPRYADAGPDTPTS